MTEVAASPREDEGGNTDRKPEDENSLEPPPEALDYYISYREIDSNGYTDKDIASRLAGALQRARGANGDSISVFAPDGEDWETRLNYGLKPARSILLIISEDGLRRIHEAHRAQDIQLLEIEYALAEKIKGNKKVLLLLAKDKKGANFSCYSTAAFPDGVITKVAQPPCHKSKFSAKLWDNGAKGDLLVKGRKPGEHTVRETMDEMFRLSGRNISVSSKDVKALVPEIIAMQQLVLPDLPSERLNLSKNEQVDKEYRRLIALLKSVSPHAAEIAPLLKTRFGVSSVEDLAALRAEQLSQSLTVDSGHVVFADSKGTGGNQALPLQTIFVDNGNKFSDTDFQAAICKKLTLLGLESQKEAQLPDFAAQQPFWRKIETGGLHSISGVSLLGKTLAIGGEERLVTACQPALLMKRPKEEEGAVGCVYTEITEELIHKYKDMKRLQQLDKYKGPELEVPQGVAVVYLKVALDRPWDRDKSVNAFVDKGVMKDLSNNKDPAPYTVSTRLDEGVVSRIIQATQTSLGIRPGEVSLAQNYSQLFAHRINNSEGHTALNHQLMAAIRAQQVREVVEALNKGASPNFMEEVLEMPAISGAIGAPSPRKAAPASSPLTATVKPQQPPKSQQQQQQHKHLWTPLIRACSARIDAGDLGMNYIAVNQIVELLIKAGADVAQVNDYGRSALHYAAMEGNYYACTILVHAGAPVDAKDNTTVPDPIGGGTMVGANAAHHARLWKKNEWEKCVQLLELYSDEPAPPEPEGKKGKKGKGKKKKKK